MARSSAKRLAFFVTNMYDCALAKFLAILKINAVSVFVGALAMFLVLWSWPTTWAPNTSHNIGLYTVMVTFQVACSFCKIVDISTRSLGGSLRFESVTSDASTYYFSDGHIPSGVFFLQNRR